MQPHDPHGRAQPGATTEPSSALRPSEPAAGPGGRRGDFPEHHAHGASARAEHAATEHGRRVEQGDHAGHDKHAGHSVGMFRNRFWVSLVLTIPTVIWGHMLPSALGREPPAFPGAALIPPVLGTAVFVYGGRV